MNRIEQMREKISSLESENERLQEALRRVIDVGPEALDENIGAGLGGKIRRICKDALDGGGNANA
jgi:RecA/RadA recombinase